jgi:threonine dehydrogenase-like Zn-dependent dehydrogenase
VCGSDLWPYRGIQPIDQPTPMGHEYCGIVEEVGRAVTSVKPGQFVIGSGRRGRHAFGFLRQMAECLFRVAGQRNTRRLGLRCPAGVAESRLT